MSHKYHAQPTTVNGIKFDSRRESVRYLELDLAQKAGVISNLQVHPTFELQPAFTDRAGKKQRAIVYEADFSYVDKATGQPVIEEIKGYDRNRAWLIKQKLFLYRYRDLELRIVK